MISRLGYVFFVTANSGQTFLAVFLPVLLVVSRVFLNCSRSFWIVAVRQKRKSARRTQAATAQIARVRNRFHSELERGKSTVEFGKTLQVLNVLGFRMVDLELRSLQAAIRLQLDSTMTKFVTACGDSAVLQMIPLAIAKQLRPAECAL